jgi:RNA polymerase sigma factor (sigma-70 family)
MSDLVVYKENSQMANQSFNQIFEREKNKLLGFVAKNVSDFTDAEDITQEVFSQFYETYDVMRPIENTSAWLFRMARNKIVDLFRKRKTRENYDAVNSGKSNLHSYQADKQWSDAMMQTLFEVLDSLPDEQSEVFVMAEMEGLSFKQIAEKTGEKVNTLISRKRYAVLELRKRLADYYNDINQ